VNVFLFYIREEDGCTRRENRTGSRGIRKRKEKRTVKRKKRDKKK